MSRKQLHLWVTQRDHEFLRTVADLRGEPVSQLLRSLLRGYRASYDRKNPTIESGGETERSITDSFGEPLEGIAVQARRLQRTGGTSRLVPIGAIATTDDRGEYRLYNLPPGDYLSGQLRRWTICRRALLRARIVSRQPTIQARRRSRVPKRCGLHWRKISAASRSL